MISWIIYFDFGASERVNHLFVLLLAYYVR